MFYNHRLKWRKRTNFNLLIDFFSFKNKIVDEFQTNKPVNELKTICEYRMRPYEYIALAPIFPTPNYIGPTILIFIILEIFLFQRF